MPWPALLFEHRAQRVACDGEKTLYGIGPTEARGYQPTQKPFYKDEMLCLRTGGRENQGPVAARKHCLSPRPCNRFQPRIPRQFIRQVVYRKRDGDGFCNCIDESLLVLEMPVERRSMDTELIGEAPHGERFKANFVEEAQCRLYDAGLIEAHDVHMMAETA